MLNWFTYNVVLPLLPVPLVYFGAWLVGIRKRLLAIIRDGQLCFYCTSLAAVCLNEIFKAGKALPKTSVGLAVGGLILCLIISTFTYGVAVTMVPGQGEAGTATSDQTRFGMASIAIAVVRTFIVAGSVYVLGLTE